MNFLRTLRTGLGLAWRDRFARRVGLAAAVLFTLAYAFVLPASMTNGAVGWVSLRLINWQLALWALALGISMGGVTGSVTALIRRGAKTRTAGAGGGVLIGALTPLLCCGPLIPIIFGFLAGLIPAIGGIGGWTQGFIATHETELLSVALALILLSLVQNARRLASPAACRPSRRHRQRLEA